MDASEVEAHAVDAFASLGIAARADAAATGGIDLILEPDTINISLTLRYRSLVTDLVASQLVNDTRAETAALFVVADRVTASARAVLLDHGAGYLDLRGRTALRTRSLILDTDIAPIKVRTERSSALAGKAGLEVACAVLTQPHQGLTVRELARELGRAPSTISEILSAMRRENLVDAQNRLSGTGTELFWLAADHWHRRRTHLVRLPPPGDSAEQRPLRLGLDSPGSQPGWALTDTAAAAMYGAPAAFREDQRLEFFVPDQTIVRRAVTLLGSSDTAASARASLRVAPVPAAAQHRIELPDNRLEWPLAHPVFVALDLAQDAGRGREILDTWTPDGWTRVW